MKLTDVALLLAFVFALCFLGGYMDGTIIIKATNDFQQGGKQQ